MDVAALRMSVDSSDIVKATADLDKFSTSASKAGSTAGKVASTGTDRMAQGLSRSAQNAVAAASAVDKYAGSSTKAASSAATAAQAAMRSAQAATQAGAAARASAAGWDMLTGRMNGNFAAINNNLQALSLVPGAVNRAGRAINDNTTAMRANTGNIAAQFQDIGVTAAMGMNPMLIAMQQGTQLSAVFAQSGASMGATLAGAFKQIASASAIMTIGVVAAAAALIQMVDWTAAAQAALNGLADILVDIAPYAAAAAAALALIYAPAIVTGIITLTKAIYGLAAGLLAVIPIPVLIIGGLTAIVAAAVHFRDELTQYFGYDIVQAAHDGVNAILTAFIGTYNGIVAGWGQLPAALGDIAIRAANAVIRATADMVLRATGLLSPLLEAAGRGAIAAMGGVPQLSNPYAGAEANFNAIVNGALKAQQGIDHVGNGVARVRDLAGQAADKLRSWADAMGGTGADAADGAGAAAQSVTKVDKWGELLADADRQQRALEQAGAQIGVYGQDLAQLRREQELFNQAQDNGIVLTAAMSQELSGRAAALAAKEYANTRAQAAADNARWHTEQMRQLEVERASLGLTGEALIAYKYQQEMINQALSAGVALKDIDIQKLAEQAEAYAAAAAANDATRRAIDEQRKSMEANREIAKSFFRDWINGVREGEDFFKSFGNSVVSTLNRIIDKLIEAALEQMLFNSLLGSTAGGMGGMGSMGGGMGAGGGIGGILGSLLGQGLGSLFGGLFAQGGTFGTAERFAKGGTFTNQIISTPTLFRFANGAKIGEMGEAGPEAVMPLSRGPNGKLGVQAHGGGGGGKPQVQINTPINITQSGAFTTDDAHALAAQAVQTAVHEVRRNLRSFMIEWDVDDAVA